MTTYVLSVPDSDGLARTGFSSLASGCEYVMTTCHLARQAYDTNLAWLPGERYVSTGARLAPNPVWLPGSHTSSIASRGTMSGTRQRSDVNLRWFPAEDETFGTLAAEAVAEASAPGAAQATLRAIYPTAVVRAQEDVAAFGVAGVRWYAYRDGRLTPSAPAAWWGESGLARVAIGEDQRYVEANAEACRLFGVGSDGLIGRSWEDFAEPPAVEAAAALRWTLKRHGQGDSTFRLVRPDGSKFDIDYHTIVYRGPTGVIYETVMRERPSPT